MKVWYFICILFALYSINISIEEGSKTTYVLSNNEETKLNYHLTCFDLKEVFSNETTIDLQQLDKNLYTYLDNYFAKLIDRTYKKNREGLKKKFKIKVNKSILNPIKSKHYFVLRDQFCLILDDRYNFIPFKNCKYYILKNATYDLLKLNDRSENFGQLIVINKENCVKYYSKLKCLNQCYKRKNRLSKYIYNSNETGIIKISFEYNSTTEKDEYGCLNECERNGCKLVHFETRKIGESETKIFETAFFVSNFDYYIQLIGLICLIVNISFYQLMPELILFLNLKTEKIKKRIKKLKIIKKVLKTIRRIKKMKIAKKLGTLMIKIEKYFNLKTMILFIGLAYFLYYSTTEIKKRNYLMKNPYEYQTEIYLDEPEILNLVVCTNVNEITEKDYRRKTLLELEKATDRGFNDLISEIYLQFQNKKRKIDWKLKKNKVLFRKIDLMSQSILRCFQIEIYPHEPKYQSLLAISKLKIKFKNHGYILYLISKDENFNSESYEIFGKLGFIKKIESRLKSNEKENCFDYKEAYSYCNSRQNCIDRCSSVKFVKMYKNASIDSIIDKEHFTVDQWKNSFINNSQDYFSELEKECKMEFKKKNCREIVFERNSLINEAEDKIEEEIDLYYYVISKEDEEPSLHELVTGLPNMQSILLGQNVFKLLMMVYYLLKIKLKVKGSINYLFLIYLICLSGFIYNTCIILGQVANGELTYFGYYKIETSIKMSEIIFCFDFDLNRKRINKNYKLTENYLDELSKEIKIESIFEKVGYLNNKSNEWISLNTPNFANSEFKIESFYFLDKKCFKIQQDMEFDRDQLNLLQIKDVLKINFNRTFIHQKDLNIYFFTKISNTMQFSRITNLIFSEKHRKFIYIINQKSVEQEYSLLDDTNSYFINLMNDFGHNQKLRSLKLPLERTKSNKEIDEDLFEQHYKQIENMDRKSTKSLYIQKLFITNNVKREEKRIYYSYSDPDFRFELNFVNNRILIANEKDFFFYKKVLDLLNVLSLWADLCILDLYVYVYYAYHKTVFVFITFHRMLIRIHTFLFEYVYCYDLPALF